MITIEDITLVDFKTWFSRDFLYATSVTGATRPGCDGSYVTDADLEKAKIEAAQVFNPGLFGTDTELRTAFYYIWAFYLVNDLQTSAQGANSTPLFMVNSRTVGGVSESYTIPDWLAKDPILSAFAMNRYGQKYISIIKPLLVGNVQIALGWTTFQ